MTKSSIAVNIKGPSRWRTIYGSIMIAIGGFIWGHGESVINRGWRVEDDHPRSQ